MAPGSWVGVARSETRNRSALTMFWGVAVGPTRAWSGCGFVFDVGHNAGGPDAVFSSGECETQKGSLRWPIVGVCSV